MNKIDFSRKLDYKDVLLVPKISTLSSRSQVVFSKNISFKFSKHVWTGVPIISSNMDTVSNFDTFNVLRHKKMLTCFPKYLNEKWLKNDIPSELKDVEYYSLSTGIKKDDINVIKSLISKLKDHGILPRFLCFDVANGYMIDLVHTCYTLRQLYPSMVFIAGNVVTPQGVKELILNGQVDLVKVGIGSGALCTTRKITGVGFPQFSAVMECGEKAHDLGGHIIADGGINMVGDISKALGAGGDFVMLGSMLAGHDISPGSVIDENGKKYKIVYGMSSFIANERYYGGLKTYKAAEGKVAKIPVKGRLIDTLSKIEGGIRSTCTYIGSSNLNEMYEKSNFIVVNNQYNSSLDTHTIME